MDDLLPMLPPLEPASPSVVLPGSAPAGRRPSAMGQLIAGSDAEAELVKGILDHQLILSSRGTLAAAFLHHYCGPEIVDTILMLRRYHQHPRGLVKALDATSLKSFMAKGLQLNVGKS